MKLWKIQKFFGDVVYDLRSRRLLPVVILLVIALVAVPVLISRGGNSSADTSIKPASGSANAVPETEQAVMAYLPSGVRNYKKRLDDQSAKNPFRDQFNQPTAASSASSQLNSTVTPPASGASVSSSSSSSSTSLGVGGGSSTGASNGSGSTTTSTKTTTHRFFLIHSVGDVSFGDASQPLERHKKLKNYASLPYPTAPVLIYLGSTLDQKKALFAVSRNTDQVTVEGTCIPDPTDCSLLALAPGQSADMVYGPDGKFIGNHDLEHYPWVTGFVAKGGTGYLAITMDDGKAVQKKSDDKAKTQLWRVVEVKE